jgi:hypothetical protein
MIIEKGTREDFKHSLLYGHAETVETFLRGVESRGLLVLDKWYAPPCSCHLDYAYAVFHSVRELSKLSAMLHVETWINWYGLPFELSLEIKVPRCDSLYCLFYDPTPAKYPRFKVQERRISLLEHRSVKQSIQKP